MPLSVLHVGYALAPVGPNVAGGAEQIVSLLDSGLTQAGHRSIVISGEQPSGVITSELRRDVYQRHRQRIDAVLRREPIDLVHMHGIDCWEYLPDCQIPTLITLHLPTAWYPSELLSSARTNIYFNGVSEWQARRIPWHPRVLPVVLNGIDLEAFRATRPNSCTQGSGFAIALGRICPEKGFHHALNAACQASARLLVAGEVFKYPAHVQYFEREIVPRTDRMRRFIGPVGFSKKRRLYQRARCTLIPSLAPESSSLVAMESIASGTPVIAFKSGALPEIVDEGVTGFLVNDEREMAQRLKDLFQNSDKISAVDCCELAQKRFSAQRMVKEYIARYELILQCTHSARSGDS